MHPTSLPMVDHRKSIATIFISHQLRKESSSPHPHHNNNHCRMFPWSPCKIWSFCWCRSCMPPLCWPSPNNILKKGWPSLPSWLPHSMVKHSYPSQVPVCLPVPARPNTRSLYKRNAGRSTGQSSVGLPRIKTCESVVILQWDFNTTSTPLQTISFFCIY